MADQYDQLIELERVFLENVKDDEIAEAFRAARSGNKAADLKLIDIAHEDAVAVRRAKADRALYIVYGFRMETH